jgi:hypothetical protein
MGSSTPLLIAVVAYASRDTVVQDFDLLGAGESWIGDRHREGRSRRCLQRCPDAGIGLIGPKARDPRGPEARGDRRLRGRGFGRRRRSTEGVAGPVLPSVAMFGSRRLVVNELDPVPRESHRSRCRREPRCRDGRSSSILEWQTGTAHRRQIDLSVSAANIRSSRGSSFVQTVSASADEADAGERRPWFCSPAGLGLRASPRSKGARPWRA